MRGVATRYPLFDARIGRPVTLAQRIEQCRVDRQAATPLPADSDALLGLTAYVGLQSRGLPMRVAVDGPARTFYEAGKALFDLREGQFNLACAQCHDDLAGQRLAGGVIPQGHPNGYPEYRLEWQGMGSLERRIRGCMVGVRAEPFAGNSIELVELELYLGARANAPGGGNAGGSSLSGRRRRNTGACKDNGMHGWLSDRMMLACRCLNERVRKLPPRLSSHCERSEVVRKVNGVKGPRNAEFHGASC